MAKTFEKVLCHVKWYDELKNFGFFILPDEGGDVFVHRTCLEAAGFKPKAMVYESEAVISYELKDDGKRRCTTVHRLGDELVSTKPKPKPAEERSRQVVRKKARPKPELKLGDSVVVEIKVYFDDKGFGFAKTLPDGPDLFFHISTVPEDLQEFLQPGERFDARVGEKERGFVAVIQQRHEEALAAE